MESLSSTEKEDLVAFAHRLLSLAQEKSSASCLHDDIQLFACSGGDVAALFAKFARAGRDANLVGSILAACGEWGFLDEQVRFLGANALHWSVIEGDVNRVRTLIRHGFDVNAKLSSGDEWGASNRPIHYNQAPVIEYLKKINRVDSPALVMALESGYEEMASYLIYVGADILAVNDGISIAKLCESSDIAKKQYESALLSRRIQDSMGVVSEGSGGLARKSGRASKFSI